jgi:hypothetical protein
MRGIGVRVIVDRAGIPKVALSPLQKPSGVVPRQGV